MPLLCSLFLSNTNAIHEDHHRYEENADDDHNPAKSQGKNPNPVDETVHQNTSPVPVSSGVPNCPVLLKTAPGSAFRRIVNENPFSVRKPNGWSM
jgi:hypothetical protein